YTTLFRSRGLGDDIAEHGRIGPGLNLLYKVIAAKRHFERYALRVERKDLTGQGRVVLLRSLDRAVRRRPDGQKSVIERSLRWCRRGRSAAGGCSDVPGCLPTHGLILLLRRQQREPTAPSHDTIGIRTVELDPHRRRLVVDSRRVARHLKGRPWVARLERLPVGVVRAAAGVLNRAHIAEGLCSGLARGLGILGTQDAKRQRDDGGTPSPPKERTWTALPY